MSPLPWKKIMTGLSARGATCQAMICSPSAVCSRCSSACGKPAACGDVRRVSGIGYRIERCAKYSKATPPHQASSAMPTSHLIMVMVEPKSGSHPLDDVLGHLLGVAEQHHGVVAVE